MSVLSAVGLGLVKEQMQFGLKSAMGRISGSCFCGVCIICSDWEPVTCIFGVHSTALLRGP